MAVDTRNKRSSVLGIGLAAALVFPDPDGALAQADRQQAAYTYAGIDTSASSALNATARRTLVMARTERVLEATS